jgi:predicted NBD/HSP70 family sugar kinase
MSGRADGREGDDSRGVGPLHPPPRGESVSLRRQVFERVRAAGELPRVEIARQLGVSPASVGVAASELIAAGLLAEVSAARAGDTVRGRPPVALAVRPDAGCVVGIKLSGATHSAVLHDFAGRPVAEASLPHGEGRFPVSQVLDHAATLFDAVLQRAGASRSDVLAVGLGVPGFVAGTSGLVHWSPFVEGERIPLREEAAARLGMPVAIDNDANLVALAELWFGNGRALSDFAVVTIEHGVGMGLVLGGALYRGARGCGTEFGHTKVALDGALCRCGQRGCLEAYVADYALVRAAGVPPDVPMAEALDSLHRRAKQGDAGACEVFRQAGRYLALGLGNVINVFDPELILLSGERMQHDIIYADEILSEVANMAICAGSPLPRIEIHAWNDMVWARGAAALALSEATAALVDGTTARAAE